jgi:UDP-perosamine 4-acetyltransferase
MTNQLMNKNIPIIVIGAGGHASVIIDALNSTSSNIIGFTNINDEIKEIYGIPYLGNDDYIEKVNSSEVLLALGIGSVNSTVLRKQIYEKWKLKGYHFAKIIHPSVILSNQIELREGCQILMGAVVQVGVKLMENCLLNTSCSIDHDCIIGSHSHIAPGVVLSGGVVIGEGSHIGTGAIIIQGIKVGDFSTVGAGAVVIKEVPINNLAIGIPALNKQKV